MHKHYFGLAALLVILPAYLPTRCEAKPPDLPVQIDIVCSVNEDLPPHSVSPGRLFLRQLSQAQKTYRDGERCFRNGNLKRARTCFEATMRQCPQSEYARRARRRLLDVARRMDEPNQIKLVAFFAPAPKSSEVQSAENAVALSVWPAIAAALGVTHFEFEMEKDHGNRNRILGSVHFGSFGCEIRVESGRCNVTFSANRQTD